MAWKVNYTDYDKQQMEVLKDYTGQSTASKAIIHMLSSYVALDIAYQDEQKRVYELELQLNALKRAVNQKFIADDKLRDLINL